MNKKLKAKVCAAVVTCSLLAVQSLVNVGPVGVDVVSAASTSTSTSTSSSSSSSSSTSTGSTSSGSTYVSSGTSSSYKGLLSVGASGSAVKSLQTSLNKHGYKLTVDGFFGPLTSAAVKDFQKKNGLVVDGIVGPATNGKLNPVTVTAAVLGVGSTGSAVKTLQTNLNKVGYKLATDGIFGPLTAAAVKSFQKANGLAVDGWYGPLTSAKLNAKVKAAGTKTTTPPTNTTPPNNTTPPVDVKAAASTDIDSITKLKAAMAPKSKGGKWIMAINKNLSTEQDLRLDGNFVNTKTPAAVQRKVALYAQDDKHVVTARYTLTARSITIVSPNASIEHGTFNGDIYVSAPNFKLVNTIVNGNIYFTNQTAKDTFKGAVDVTSDKDSVATQINGTQTLKLNADIDVVTTASTNLKTNDAFKAAISKTGTWIAAPFTDLTFTEDLTVDGDIMWEGALARKIALYAHSNDGDARTTTDRFILTAPKLTINSPNASIQHGVFVGDVYVNKPGFKLTDAVVVGKVVFATQALKDAFKPDADSTVTLGTSVAAN